MTLRVAVLGAGAVGSAAARALASDGCAVTLFEQFQVDHDRGSSFGASRIIRKTYPDPVYTALIVYAYPLWEAFAREAGEELLVATGGLFFGDTNGADLQTARRALVDHDVPHTVLSPSEVARRFPALRLRANEIAVHEPDAGMLRASACVRAAVRLAVAHGAVLRERTEVVAIEPVHDSVAIVTGDGARESFDRVAVCAGPWTRRVCGGELPLRVTRQVYCHFHPRAETGAFDVGAFPIWIDMDTLVYGFPRDGLIPGVKLARHGFGTDADPDSVERTLSDADRAPLIAYARERLHDLTDRVAFEKVCLYTNTPDADFVIDRWREDPRVAIVAGLSGHGFKFAVLLGRIAAWMCEDREVPFDLGRFRASRF